MAFFVIAGKPDCPAFVHVAHVANYLTEHLPHFKVHKMQKESGDWEPWLNEINHKNKWNHYRSPIIWKEISMQGGKAYLIGGISEFWEYCYDYYGLESLIPQEDLLKLVDDNMMFFTEMKRAEHERSKHIRNICISGACNPLITVLLPELLKIPELELSFGIVIKLFDEDFEQPDKQEFLLDLYEDILPLATNGSVETIQIIQALDHGLPDCDLLILLDDISRRSDEEETNWLKRNMFSMFHLADSINALAKRHLRVILANNGPVCFNATLLVDMCTRIRVQNIVAVTSDLGLCSLHFAAKQADILVQNVGAPPVWGFIGINQFVDIESAVIHCDIYRPNKRVLKNKGGSTLPLGKIQSELRFMGYLIDDIKGLWENVAGAKEKISTELNRAPLYSKVRSLVKLLKLWYSKSSSDDIISLGVCSNGSFGFHSGTVFSQPVILQRHIWVPFTNFPLTQKSKEEISNLIPPAMQLLEELEVNLSIKQQTSTSTIFSLSDDY